MPKQVRIEAMNEQRILEELVGLLEANGITVRKEPLGGSGGGLCTVKGEKMCFVDTQAPSAETAVICTDAVSTVVDIEGIYIKPEIRRFIEEHTQKEWA